MGLRSHRVNAHVVWLDLAKFFLPRVVPFCIPTAVEEVPHSCPQLPSQFCQNDQPFTFCQFDTCEGFYYHSIHCKLFEHSLNIVSLNIFKEHLLIFCELCSCFCSLFKSVWLYSLSIRLLYMLGILILYLWYIFKYFLLVCYLPLDSAYGVVLLNEKKFFFIFMLSNFSFIAPWFWVIGRFPPTPKL